MKTLLYARGSKDKARQEEILDIFEKQLDKSKDIENFQYSRTSTWRRPSNPKYFYFVGYKGYIDKVCIADGTTGRHASNIKELLRNYGVEI